MGTPRETMEEAVQLEGKVAIVTGASRGIGRECAIELAREGVSVVGAARDRDAIARTVATIQDDGGKGVAIPCDVTDREQVDALIDKAVGDFGAVHILVNAAQTHIGEQRLEDCSGDQIAVALGSGLYGTLNVMQSAFPHLREARGASIINFGDPDAVVGEPGRAANNVSKEAIRALSRTAAREWGRFGIRVNVVNPTVLSSRLKADLSRAPDLESWLLGQIPGGRLGEPKEVARTVVFLASSDSAMLTGMTLHVDGGRSMYA